MPTAPDIDQEPQYRCSHCSRLLYQSELARAACFVCETRAQHQLRVIPDLYADLGNLLQPGRTGNGNKVAASKTAPLPAALHPLDMRAWGGITTDLLGVEYRWRAALHRKEATFAGSVEQTLGTVVQFLQMNLVIACEEYGDIADDLDTIGTVYWRARNAIAGTQPRFIPVHCRLLYGDGQECGAELLVDINRTSVKCGTCGTRWGQQEWMALFEATRATAA